jgi:hypothetical protein
VGDCEDRDAAVAVERRQEIHDHAGGRAVDITCGLVGKQKIRLARYGASDRNSLLLSSGHFGRAVVGPTLEAEFGQDPFGFDPRFFPARAASRPGEGHVVTGVEGSDQVEELEDKPDMVSAVAVELALGGVCDVDAGDGQVSRIGAVEPADQVEQGRLPAPAWSHYQHHLASLHREVDAAQRFHGSRPAPVHAGEAGGLDQGHAGAYRGYCDGRPGKGNGLLGFLRSMGGIGNLMLLGAVGSLVGAVFASGDAQGALLTVALSLGISGFVFRAFGKKMGRLSGVDERLREVGIPGTAKIISMSDTGITVNQNPVAGFTLEVSVEGREPYQVDIRQLLSRLMTGAVLPGMTVPVLVDPDKPNRVAISGSPDPDQVAAASKPEITTVSAAELLRKGRRGTAVITSMQDIGDLSDLGVIEEGAEGDDDRAFLIGLDVKLPGRSSYAATTGHRVPERLLGKVGPRTEVDVAVDRDDDQQVAIDWSSVE